LSGYLWILSHPSAGIIEAEDMDHEVALSYISQYLGELKGVYSGRPQKLSATPDHFGKVLPHVLSRTQRHRARHDPDRPVQWLQP
ncbi:hypothetical protein KZ843_39540, partial [Pseudomonas aeruginosa]